MVKPSETKDPKCPYCGARDWIWRDYPEIQGKWLHAELECVGCGMRHVYRCKIKGSYYEQEVKP